MFILYENMKILVVGYAYVECLSDLYKARSQTRYAFIYDGTMISYGSVK